MRITRLTVRNYRSLHSLDLDITDYTALVGANGAGKSSVLYALDWFFRGYDLSDSDITQRAGSPVAERIQVTVTFGELNAWDRVQLGEYGRGEQARFRRTWTTGQSGTKVVGRAMQGPGFSDIRSAGGVTAMRNAYGAVQELHGLPRLAGNAPKNDILAALAEWENHSENLAQLVEVDDVDANHMFGINGTNVFRECIRLVLVPAATDMSSQLGDASKGSALAELIGAVITDAGAHARDEWVATHSDVIRDLNERVRNEVEGSVAVQANRINAKLNEMVPDATVSFIPTVQEWQPKGDATVATSVTMDGSTIDISRQGHGVQRAVMIALLQSLVPDALSTVRTSHGGGDPAPLEGGPALIVCIEEPEIYQHPVRARSFGRVLANLSTKPEVQVIVATHSPYFVSPDQFESIRRFRIKAGRTAFSVASINEVQSHAGVNQDAVRKFVQKQVPTTFSEGFFADAVVLVEGDTDRAVIECLAIRLGTPLDERGTSLLELGGKTALRVPHAIFTSLDVPAFVVIDGDSGGAQRKHPSDDSAADREQADASNKRNTETVVAWLPEGISRQGRAPYIYGDPSVITDQYIIWQDDFESELAQWPSFMAALEGAGCRLRQKNALAYRTAVLEANLDDLPQTLRSAIETIAMFGVTS